MSGLGDKARSAVIWNTAFNIFRDGVQFVTMLVLVRILKPEAYGQFGLVMSVIGFLAIFSVNNFLAHTLQVRDDGDVHYQSQFTAGAVITIIVVAATNVFALICRQLETYAPVAPLLHVMSLNFLLDWPCEFRRKMLEREYNWKRLRSLHAIGLLVNGALAVAMAMLGAGVYALLVPGMMVTLPFIVDLFVIQRWRPNWSWSREKFLPAWRFGVTRIGSGLTVSGRQLLESGVLTRVLGFANLGIFNRALGLAQIFCVRFASQLMYAIYPVLTRLHPDEKNRARVNALVFRAVAWVVVPISALFALLAFAVVQTVYGKQWGDVVPLLPWAMLFGVAASLTHTGNMLLLSNQQQKRCFIADVLLLMGTVIALFAGLPNGTKFYLIGLVAAQIFVLALIVAWLVRSRLLTVEGIAFAILPAIFSCAAAFTFCEMARFSFNVGVEKFSTAFAYGVCFGIIYLTGLRLVFAPQLTDLLAYFPATNQIRRLLLLPAKT